MNKNLPRVINEFEGKPNHLYLGKGVYGYFEGYPYILLDSCKNHPIFRELKISPTIESISKEEMDLYVECDECDDCNPNTCPKPLEEVNELGSGMKRSERLKGWFVDFDKCIPWKVCECCKGTGHIK